MATFSEAKATINAIVNEGARLRTRLADAKKNIREVSTAANNMATTFGGKINAIEAEAIANADDADWQRVRSEKDKLVADFLVFRNEVQALIAAIGD